MSSPRQADVNSAWLATPNDLPPELRPTVSEDDPQLLEGGESPVTALGTISSQQSEVRALLQHRLAVIAPVGVFAWGAFLISSLLGIDENRTPAQIGGLVELLVAANVAYLAVVAILARLPREWPLTTLRAMEAGHYGLLIVAMATLRILIYLRAFSDEFPATGPHFFLDAATAMITFGFLVGICLAGVVFPNTRRRATAIVLGMTATPLIIDAAFAVAHPERLSQIGFAAMQTGQMLLFAVTLALFASAKIEALQQEVSAARREAREARALGPYLLKRRLGEGGMGEVYKAEHRLLKRPCVVKLIRAERAGDPRALARFDREVQATAQLKHPNTVEVFDYGRTEDGVFYYVMEYLEGLSLEEIVHRYGPLPPARVVRILRQVCGALREAHGLGLVHRDIKPSNILLCRYGGLDDMAKLLDFGLVQTASDPADNRLTQAGGFVGTPDFMSPEQASGAAPDARSDIYSLGATAFYLLSGQPPFSGESPLDVLFAHRHQRPPTFAEIGHNVPADLEAVIRRCLAKAPGDRYPNVEALDAALRGCQLNDAWTDEHAQAWWRSVVMTAPTPTLADQPTLEADRLLPDSQKGR